MADDLTHDIAPRDFLTDDNSPQYEVGVPARDFLSYQKPETLEQAAYFALPRMYEDTLTRGVNFAKNIPGYYESAKTEVPGIFKTFKENPFHVGGQLAAGITEQGHNLLNTPSDISNYIENRLHLTPQGFTKENIPSQRDISGDINEIFGEPKYPGEKLARGIGRNALLLGGGASLANKVNPFTALRKMTPEAMARKIQVSHDALEQSASDKFTNVGKEVTKRNIVSVPLRQNLIADISQHSLMPKTKKITDLLNKAYSGDYGGLRKLQTELFQRAKKGFKSNSPADQMAGEELEALREEINDSITKHLTDSGHSDLASELNRGRKQYAQLKDIYYNKKLPLSVRQLVDKETRKMPKQNIFETLNEESKPMNALKEYNPFIQKDLTRYQQKQNAIRNLRRLGIGSILGIGGGSLMHTAKSIYDYLTNESK